MEIISSRLRTLSASITRASETSYWVDQLTQKYGIEPKFDNGVHDAYTLVRNIFIVFSKLPTKLVKDCGINTLMFRTDMGPNKPYYPNHGYFKDHLVALNADIFYHPDNPEDFVDNQGYYLTRAEQTVLHEFGHGYDANQGKDKDLSLEPGWLSLSGWSETKKPGLERLVIQDPGVPKVIGEWWYDPKEKFTRFYAKRNPWDDWADTFSYYVANMNDITPPKKKVYFDNLLGHYYKTLPR